MGRSGLILPALHLRGSEVRGCRLWQGCPLPGALRGARLPHPLCVGFCSVMKAGSGELHLSPGSPCPARPPFLYFPELCGHTGFTCIARVLPCFRMATRNLNPTWTCLPCCHVLGHHKVSDRLCRAWGAGPAAVACLSLGRFLRFPSRFC